MIVHERRISGGFLKITYEIKNDHLTISEKNFISYRVQEIALKDLAPEFIQVKQGIPGLLTSGLYFFCVCLFFNIIQEAVLNTHIPFLGMGSVLLIGLFILEHLKLFKAVHIPFRADNRVVQISHKNNELIEELSKRIKALD